MKKNVAVVGYGGQGGWHCKEILKSEVVSLAGVYDIKEDRNRMATEQGIFVYPSFEALINDKKVDIVVIATPNDSHKQLTIAALGAGKNVICEKPVEMSCAALKEMLAAAEKSGRLFTVHQNRRWDVDFLAIKNIAEQGDIGKVINIESRIHGSRGIPSDWRAKKEYGGGMILDWGVHLIDQILCILGKEKLVRVCCTTTYITESEVDDGFKLNLFFEGGATAYIEVGTYNFLPLPRFYMQCEKGTALITDWREKAKVARLKAWNEKDVLPVQTAAGITKTMAPRDEITLDIYEAERPESDVHDFYRNFCAAMDGRSELTVKHEEIMRVMRVMEAAFKSAEIHQAVETDI